MEDNAEEDRATQLALLNDNLTRVRENAQALPKVAAALSLWIANYLDLLVADIDRQLSSDRGLLDAMILNWPSRPTGG